MSLFTNKVKLTILGSCVMLMTLTNCGGSDDGVSDVNCGDGSWLLTVESEAIAWLAATQVYAQDPTIENCQNNKSTAQAYLDILESTRSCVPNADLADFQDALDEARENLNDIICE